MRKMFDNIKFKLSEPREYLRDGKFNEALWVLARNFTSSVEDIEKQKEIDTLEDLWDFDISSESRNPFNAHSILEDISRDGCTRRLMKVSRKDFKPSKDDTEEPDEFLAAKEVNLWEAEQLDIQCLRDEIVMLKQVQDSSFFLEFHGLYYMRHLKSSWLISEYVSVGDLDRVLLKVGRFTQQQVRAAAAQISLGISHLHKKRIIHADIKSENILLTRDGIIKIVDFDVSFTLKKRYLTSDKGESPGSPLFMAPEMFPPTLELFDAAYNGGEEFLPRKQRIQYGSKIDIWAMGIVLLDLLYGENVFEHAIQKGGIMDEETIYKWKDKNAHYKTVMADVIALYCSDDHTTEGKARHEATSAELTENTSLSELIFQKCIVVKEEDRASAKELQDMPFIYEILDELPSTASKGEILDTEAATVLRELVHENELSKTDNYS